MNTSTLLDGLNEEQRAAVVHTTGPQLVLAGAGTGKTRVITTRIANLIAQGVDPLSIAAVSFTRKAGAEMQSRVFELVGDIADEMRISTFHSLGLSILRENHEIAGLERSFGVCDDKKRRLIAEQVLDKLAAPLDDEHDRELEITDLLRSISSAKTAGRCINSLLTSHLLHDRYVGEALAYYDQALREQQLIDLDDMVRLPVDILESNATLRDSYQNRYRHVLIDEYQDSNLLQHRLMRCLVGPEENICVVGDDDQSIYGFRGAKRELILSFESDFPSARVVKLVENYRCSEEIIDVANEVISNSQQRFEKQLIAANGSHAPVRLVEAPNREHELRFIAQDIANSDESGDVAILFRTQRDISDMRQELKSNGVSADSVQLMTLHASKGLEFARVYLPSLEESTLPHWNAIQGGIDAVEEERRLFYVGVTRARKKLTLSLSRRCGSHAREQSRFADTLLAKNLVSRSEISAA